MANIVTNKVLGIATTGLKSYIIVYCFGFYVVFRNLNAMANTNAKGNNNKELVFLHSHGYVQCDNLHIKI